MIELKNVTTKQLKIFNFYIMWSAQQGLSLVNYIGWIKNRQGRKVYYFYDVIGLLGINDCLIENQLQYLKPIVDKVFNHKLDIDRLNYRIHSLGTYVYESPEQYKVKGIDIWYQKNRVLNQSLVDLIME